MLHSSRWYNDPSSVLEELRMERRERAGCPAIDGYIDVEELYRGGQGIVYAATQKSTRRRVAIKVLREGMYASASARYRFEREIELIAGLRHPNIVSVYDSGVTVDGRLFYVMEFVEGKRLDHYLQSHGADSVSPSSKQHRLRLFSSICAAVNYAHQKGVIHRDLKPGNILVDASGESRVLDFGLAKFADQAASVEQAGQMSITGQFMGSLPWASPEQVKGEHGNIDVRTDVYSLGVIFYQMMTGRFPYAVDGNIRDVTHSILHTDPPKPARSKALLDDDLFMIVRSCMAKEPERRYQSAGDIVREIDRYMAGEPILARPPSAIYQFSKFARRHRAFVAGVAISIILLMLGVYGTTYGLIKARDQRDRALKAEKRASAERDRAIAINEFLNDMLSSVDPRKSGYRVTVAELLDQAARDVESQFADEPGIRSSLRHTIGEAYINLGLYDAAEPLIRAALDSRRRHLGDSHPDTLASIEIASIFPSFADDPDEAEAMLRHVVQVRRQSLGDDHPLTLRAMIRLAGVQYAIQFRFADAEALLRKTCDTARKSLGEDHPETLRAMNQLARVLHFQGRLAAAEEQMRAMLKVCRRNPDPEYRWTLAALIDLAGVLHTWGRDSEAEPYLREALEAQRNVFGDSHPNTLMTMHCLIESLLRLNRIEEAERWSLIAAGKIADGDLNIAELSPPRGLALVRQAQGRLDEAEMLYRRVVELARHVYGPSNTATLRAMHHLAVNWMQQRRWREAASLLSDVLKSERNLLETAWLRWEIQADYGYCLAKNGEFSTAEPILAEAYNELARILGVDHPKTQKSARYNDELVLVSDLDTLRSD